MPRPVVVQGETISKPVRANDVMVIGSLAADTSCDYDPFDDNADASPLLSTSNPARITQSSGGVGRNVATAAQYAGAQVGFASVLADDLAGKTLLQSLKGSGIDTEDVMVLDPASGARTAQYVAVNDKKRDLMLAMGDFSIFAHEELQQREYWENLVHKQASKPSWMVVDGNWSADILSYIMDTASKNKIPLAFEPVSVAKAVRVFESRAINQQAVLPRNLLSLATPNKLELAAMHSAAERASLLQSDSWWEIIDSFGLSSAGSRDKFVSLAGSQLADEGIPQQVIRLLPYIPNLVTKLGSSGCLLASVLPKSDRRLTDPAVAPYILSRSGYEGGVVGGIYMRLFPPAQVVAGSDIVSVNGVGDTLLGVIVAGLARSQREGESIGLDELVSVAQRAAIMTLKSTESVSPDIQKLRW